MGGIMIKFESLFAHLLKLFIDTDRIKKEKGKNRFSVEEKEQDHNGQKILAESETSS